MLLLTVISFVLDSVNKIILFHQINFNILLNLVATVGAADFNVMFQLSVSPD